MSVIPMYYHYDECNEPCARVSINVLGTPVDVDYFHVHRDGVDLVFVSHPCFYEVNGGIYQGGTMVGTGGSGHRGMIVWERWGRVGENWRELGGIVLIWGRVRGSRFRDNTNSGVAYAVHVCDAAAWRLSDVCTPPKTHRLPSRIIHASPLKYSPSPSPSSPALTMKNTALEGICTCVNAIGRR